MPVGNIRTKDKSSKKNSDSLETSISRTTSTMDIDFDSILSSPIPNPLNTNTIDNKQLIRLIMQYFQDIGLNNISDQIGSQLSLQIYLDPNLKEFIYSIKANDYESSLKLLKDLSSITHDQRCLIHFLISKQKFLDQLLIEKNDRKALALLRDIQNKVNQSTINNENGAFQTDSSHPNSNTVIYQPSLFESKLKSLTSLLVDRSDEDCLRNVNYLPTNDNNTHNRLDKFTYEFSATSLLNEISHIINSMDFIPPNRLLTLVNQSLLFQTYKDPFYLPDIQTNESNRDQSTYSLFNDIHTHESQFPKKIIKTLSYHEEECWYVKYSNTGKYLASTSKDGKIIIYDVLKNYQVLYILKNHTKAVIYISFSQDDSKLISTSMDLSIKLWDLNNDGKELNSLKLESSGNVRYWSIEFLNNTAADSTDSDLNNSNDLFIVGSPDKKLAIYNTQGVLNYDFEINSRINDLKITPNGEKLLIVTHTYDLIIFELSTKKVLHVVHIGKKLTSLSIDPMDSNHCLINVSSDSLQLWNIKEKPYLVQKYYGARQSKFVIRSCLTPDLVICGSVDGDCYTWNKHSGNLITSVKGHKGLVNSIDWNHHKINGNIQWASCGDDGIVQIWSV